MFGERTYVCFESCDMSAPVSMFDLAFFRGGGPNKFPCNLAGKVESRTWYEHESW